MPSILVVDDSALDQRVAGGLVEKLGDYEVMYADNGVEAINLIANLVPEAVLTDLQMPEMDGLELVQRVRLNYPSIPVILMTGVGSEDIAVEALRKGAASYIPKSKLKEELGSTLTNVLSSAVTQQARERLLECLTQSDFRFELENDSSLIPTLITHLQEALSCIRFCDQTSLIRVGISLHEAVTNAIYHGNLELTSELLQTDEEKYHDLAKQRQHEPPYRDRRVTVTIRISLYETVITVADQGSGFDPSVLPDPTAPENMENITGRGLLLIRSFMDDVRHNREGNQITMVLRSGRAT